LQAFCDTVGDADRVILILEVVSGCLVDQSEHGPTIGCGRRIPVGAGNLIGLVLGVEDMPPRLAVRQVEAQPFCRIRGQKVGDLKSAAGTEVRGKLVNVERGIDRELKLVSRRFDRACSGLAHALARIGRAPSPTQILFGGAAQVIDEGTAAAIRR